MSLFNDASLVMIPSGYKNGKVYSVKPTDGAGDLTFTRASSATRVQSDGLIEKVRTNLLTYSEQFDNAAWTKAGCSVTANSTTDPFGTSNADVVVEDALPSTQHRLLQIQTISNATEHSTSLYVKRIVGTRDFSIINIVSGARVYFNLTTGTVGDEVLGTGSIQNVGNGWYRCTATGVSTGITASIFLCLTNAASAGSETYSGDGVSSLAFYGAQLETGVATDYIATTTTAVSVGPVSGLPRLDYLNSSCPRLLLEPQRTNIALFSEQFDNAVWTKTRTTVSANSLVSPDGNLNADKIDETATTGVHQISATITVTAGVHTMSVFAKKGERNFVRVYEDTTANGAYFNLNTGVIGTIDGPTATAKIEDYGNGWYRCSVTYTEGGIICRIRVAVAQQDAEASYSGTAGNGIYAWGAQCEAGAYATSYIPTLSTSVTRVADAASKTGISSLIGQTEGTLFVEMKDLVWTASALRLIGVSDGTFNNRVALMTGQTSNTYRVIVTNGGALQTSTTASGTFGNVKVALAYSSAGGVIYVNGTQVLSYASISVPSTSAVYLGMEENGNASSQPNGPCSQALLFKTRLTNAQLAELTTL
jgi:hypothetical protein